MDSTTSTPCTLQSLFEGRAMQPGRGERCPDIHRRCTHTHHTHEGRGYVRHMCGSKGRRGTHRTRHQRVAAAAARAQQQLNPQGKSDALSFCHTRGSGGYYAHTHTLTKRTSASELLLKMERNTGRIGWFGGVKREGRMCGFGLRRNRAAFG